MFRDLHPARRLLLAIPVAGTIIAVALTTAWLLRSDSHESPDLVPLTLQGIQQDDLDELGIRLYEPRGDVPDFTAADFEAVVNQPDLGLPREVRLAWQVRSDANGGRRLVWVRNLEPLTMPDNGPTKYTLFALSFVDAYTNEFLSTTAITDYCWNAAAHPKYEDVTGPICSGQVHF